VKPVDGDVSLQVVNRAPGVYDLVVADRRGEVSLLVNTGSPGAPNFSEKRVLKPGKP